MEQVIVLPPRARPNRAVHVMAVIVVILFAFHFARLSGFAPAMLAATVPVALLALASLAMKTISIIQGSAPHLIETRSLFSWPIRCKQTDLADALWLQARADLPDLVVEVETRDKGTIEITRFRNAFGRREADAALLASRIAALLGVEARGIAAGAQAEG